MNNKITALTLVAATAFAFTAKPAVAGNKELAVIGGVIGGLIIASAISDHHDTTVYHSNHHAGGYWNTVSVNVWVPGYWVTDRDYYGHSHRRYVPGRYECRNDRVWVSYNSHHRYDRGDDRHHDRYDRRDDRRDDRHDRKTGRGYGNDRDSGRDRRDNRR